MGELVCLYGFLDGTEMVQVTLLRRTLRLLPAPNVLVAISKGMWAVKLCFNKILQFLTDRLSCAIAVKW